MAALAAIFAAALLGGCASASRAYVENHTDKPIRVAITTDATVWTYWLQPGEVVSMVTDSSCELSDLHWVREATSDGRPLGTLDQLCPGQVWSISGVGAEQVTPVSAEWATKPPPNVATMPAWSPTR